MRTLILFLLLTTSAFADSRFCGVVYRHIELPNKIIRSQTVVSVFKKTWPCPTCVGWQVDHIIPLVCGGCDSVENMAWMPVEIKTCAGAVCKDRWEQKVYCNKPITTIYK